MALAESLGDEIVHDFAQVSTGTALLFVDYAMGARMLLDARERRQRRGNLIGVSRVLALIGSGSGELMLLDDAVRYLRESVRISEEHDFDGTYAHAWLSLCLAYRGAWDEASDVATGVLPRVEGANIARLMAQIAIGRMRVRRGDPGVVETLAEVGDMASASGTLQRLAPAACLHAEAAFLAGDADRVRTEVLRVLPLALAKGHPWFVAELSYWLWRLGDPVAPPPGCAEPYALEMAGEWQAAAHAWERIGCPYERGRALAHGDLAAQRSALAIFEQLGARPAAEDLRRRLRRSGVRGLARGAYSASRSHPAGLTNAETQVLVLAMMCENLRNAEIAARIHRSVRTVDHHVAAVLAKLGVQSRLEAVRRAESEGWVAPPADGNRVRRHKK
jgi:DNA-binding CsgD family transcriptional regulator